MQIAQHLRLGVVRIEDGMREVSTRSREALVVAIVDRPHERVWSRRVSAGGEYFEHLSQVGERHGLIEGDDHVARMLAKIDASLAGGAYDFRRRRRVRPARRRPYAQRIEEVRMSKLVTELLEPGGKDRRMTMNAPRDPMQTARPVPHRVHAGDDGQQHLRGAHIARRLLPPDVLLARLQSHAQRRLPVRVSRDTNDATGQKPLELITRCEKCRVWSTEAHRHAEALRAADAHVRAPLARRCKQHQAHDVGGHHHQRIRRMNTIAKIPIIVDRAVACRILHERTKNIVAEFVLAEITDNDVDATCVCTRAHDVDGLRMAAVGDKEDLLPGLPTCRVRHCHCLRGGGAFIKK